MVEKADEIKDLAERYGILLHSHIFVGFGQFWIEILRRSSVLTVF